MKKVFAFVLALALVLTSVAAMAATSTVGGETVNFKDGALTTYGEVTFNTVELTADAPFRGVTANAPAKEAAPAIVADLKTKLESKDVTEYVIDGLDEEGNLTGEPLDIVYDGKVAKLIVVTIDVTYADGAKYTERWNFVKIDGEDDYKVVACYIEAK